MVVLIITELHSMTYMRLTLILMNGENQRQRETLQSQGVAMLQAYWRTKTNFLSWVDGTSFCNSTIYSFMILKKNNGKTLKFLTKYPNGILMVVSHPPSLHGNTLFLVVVAEAFSRAATELAANMSMIAGIWTLTIWIGSLLNYRKTNK